MEGGRIWTALGYTSLFHRAALRITRRNFLIRVGFLLAYSGLFLSLFAPLQDAPLTHTENFTPHPPGPKPGVQLFEPMRAIWLFASFWLIDSPFYKTHLLNIFSEIKNRNNCCLCLKMSLKNGSISRNTLEQWASNSFQCLPFSYTRRICMNFTTKWCGSELTWQVCFMLFASLLQDAFFIIRSLALRPWLLTKNSCYYVANDSLLLLSASLLQSIPMRLLRKALLKYSTRAISTFQTQWEQPRQPRSARNTIGVQPSEVLNDMPASVGLVASRRFPVLYLREWIYHCFGILSLVELLFASLRHLAWWL